MALLKHEKEYLSWPDAEERREITARFKDLGIPGGCVGIVDGVLCPFASAPGRIDKSDFFSFKGRYGYNIQAVSDDLKRIRFVQCGLPGNYQDNRAWRHSDIKKHRSQYFSEGEWVLADSGYKPRKNLVPLFSLGRGRTELGPGEVSSASLIPIVS